MAKLQIFVLALILAQGYCVSLTNLPANIGPQANSEQPICVTYVKLILQSIIDKLSKLPSTPEVQPQPEVEIIVPDVPDIPEVIKPQDPKPEPEVTEPETPEPEQPKPEAKTPCTACFNYLTALITSAQKVAAARKYPVIALY